MTDLVDIAERVEQRQRDIALANAALPEPTTDTLCQECGDPIGENRKAYVPHATTCVDCAEILEAAQGGWAL